MSESERLETSALNAGRMLADGRLVPDDFDDEDVAMAQLLNDVFHIEGEDLPPRYAQALLGDPRYEPAADDLAERITDTVFHHLALTRAVSAAHPVVRRQVASLRPPASRAATITGKRSNMLRQGLLAVTALVVLLGFESAFNGAALANMLRYLVVGHSGVQMVKSYPTIATTTVAQVAATKPAAQGDHRILFTPQWTSAAILGYTFTGMDIMDKAPWSDSAIVIMNYAKNDATGVHHLDYYEFQVSSQTVLQVVQNGAANDVAVGNSNGVFVGGHWVQRKSPASPIWMPDQRAGLICSGIGEPGLVTWIATDDVAGYSQSDLQQRLSTVAQTMKPFTQSDFQASQWGIRYMGAHLSRDLQRVFGGDVIAISPGSPTAGGPVTYLELGTPPDFVDSTSGVLPTR